MQFCKLGSVLISLIGLASLEVAAQSVTIVHDYDAVGRLTKTSDSQRGIVNYSYDASDNRTGVAISSPNQAPVATNPTYGSWTGQLWLIPASDVATDADGDTLTYISASYGTRVGGNQFLSFTTPGSPGTFSILYTVTDPHEATVSGIITMHVEGGGGWGLSEPIEEDEQ